MILGMELMDFDLAQEPVWNLEQALIGMRLESNRISIQERI